MIKAITNWWRNFEEKRPGLAQFVMFFLVSNGVTVLQFIMMPFFKWLFSFTELVNTPFFWFPVGDGYIFSYTAGPIAEGGQGGLAFFLAVQVTIGLAQVANFFAQRSVTFKSNSNIWVAAFWYVVAYIVITFAASAALNLYRQPIYDALPETIADVVVMFINALISCAVFFPIFKVIFKQVPEEDAVEVLLDNASEDAE